MDRKQFLEVLFDIDDKTAYGKDDKETYYAKDIWPHMIHTDALKFSINPIKERRTGENVTHINSLLFEMDKDSNGNIIPRDTQIALFNSSGLPYSTMTWSGTKSVHVIVRLDEPVSEYWFRPLWRAIERVLTKHGCSIDPATMKIPQISRMPNSIRDNGNQQDLIEVRARVTKLDIVSWLKLNDETIHKPQPPRPFVPIDTDEPVTHRFERAVRWTQLSQKSEYSSYWKTGGDNWLFVLGCNLSKLGISLDQAMSLVTMKWGTTYETSAGIRDISIPISKGHKKNKTT